MSWHHPSGGLATADTLLTVTPADAGWAYSGMEVFDLAGGAVVMRTMEGIEGVLVPLSARDVVVTVDGAAFTMTGRSGVFDSVSDWQVEPVDRVSSIR